MKRKNKNIIELTKNYKDFELNNETKQIKKTELDKSLKKIIKKPKN